jgi:hypothetical protein
MSGKRSGNTNNYLTRSGYDKLENRLYLSYGNGTETTYGYDEKRRRLDHLTAATSNGRMMMANTYRYDNVDNILGITNNTRVPSINSHGGPAAYSFAYDDLYRLTGATGNWKGATNEQRFTLSMRYSPTGKILGNGQLHSRMSYDDPVVYVRNILTN